MASDKPERTREHYIEALSRHYVEGFVLRRGHTVDEPRYDYGYDVIITTFDYKGSPNFDRGEVESGAIFLQLKATDNLLTTQAGGKTISFVIKRRHAVLWQKEPMPVYLVLYSVAENKAYYLQMQTLLRSKLFVMPPKNQKELVVHISKDFVLDEAAVDQWRQLKAKALAAFENDSDTIYA